MKEYIFNFKTIILFYLLVWVSTSLSARIVYNDNMKYDYEADRYYSSRIYDFNQIKDIRKRKKLFVDFMSLIIETENRDILANRNKIKELRLKKTLTQEELTFINNIEKVYLLAISESSIDINWKELLHRVDIIPKELAITQSAIESGWGTSVFAKKANNMFGHWTYKIGTGLVPTERLDGQTHEIAIFSTINDSVVKYMLNLNTNSAYRKFRDIRQDLRKSNSELKGELLSSGLVNYSGVGQRYIELINSIIKDVSKYWRFDD